MSVAEVTGVLGLALAALTAVLGVVWMEIRALRKDRHAMINVIQNMVLAFADLGIEVRLPRNWGNGARHYVRDDEGVK